jgi:hypothetical protein
MKIKIKFLFLFLCFLLPLSNIYSQEECGFETPENYQTYAATYQNRLTNETSFCLNICFRILRDDDGTNVAMSPASIPQILNDLNIYFNPHNIYFNQVGTYDYINNTKYNNRLPNEIKPINIPNCINLYFIKSFGLNSNVVGLADREEVRAKIKGSAPFSGTTSHEVGHILNLLHTFNCTVNPQQECTDSPLTTVGCNVKGDMICDTPADYNSSVSNPDPPYPISSYHPDKTNLMSYWSNRNHFTTGQGIEMRSYIAQSPYMQGIRSYGCAKIEGQSRLCPSNSADFFVSGAEFGNPTYNWSVSSNLQINGPSNNSTVNITKTNLTGGSFLSVTINGNIVKSKKVVCSFWGYRIVGLYDWVSKDYGNMGLIVPVDSENIDEEDPTISYLWEIKENPNTENINCDGIKPFFVGNSSVDTNKFISTTNQAIVNWGNCSKSYFITCYEITQSGEKYLVSENYVDVGDSKNNPCFKNAFQTIIAPNPVRNGQVNIIVNKPDNTSPCNYKNLEEPQFFNSKLDKINNSITIFDYSGNQIYSNVFQTNEFTIENLNLISGDNYVVNLFTNEGGFSQQVIIAE